MAELKQFKLPDVGEGLTEAEILSWHVKPGDTVKVNQVIVEIETAKSAVELPSPYEGVVSELHADEGSTVSVGAPIVTIDTAPGGAPASPDATPDAPSYYPPKQPDDMAPSVPSPSPDEPVEPGLIGGPAPGGRTSVLVGYGPRNVEAKRRPRKPGAGAAPAAEPSAPADETPAPAAPARMATAAPTPPERATPAAPAEAHAGSGAPGGLVLAKPPVRKLAKDLGVDLRTVVPTGPNGVVTRQDVEQAVVSRETTAAPPAAPAEAQQAFAAPYEFDPVTREYRYPIRSVRRSMAAAMVKSAFTAPHVTEFLTVDATRTMELVDRLRETREFAGVRLSPLAVVAKALLVAVRRNPDINSTWDEERQEIAIRGYVNLGIAAATSRGLVVPNIKDAHTLTLPELAQGINDLATRARDGKNTPDEMMGGTITITNVGVFGVDTGTPILNPGEAAILAFGTIRDMPWVHEGKLAIRKVTTLGLSFDHRLVDGELGSKFLADIGAILENPDLGLVW